MAGHMKSSSHHERRVFDYSCCLWRCSLSKKRRSSPDPKLKDTLKSFDETSKASNQSNEVKSSISPFSCTAKPLMSQDSSLTSSQTQSSRLGSSISSQSADMTKPPNASTLKRRVWSHQLETRSQLGPAAGSTARSGPLLRSVSRGGPPAIVYSRSNGLVKLLTVEESLECSLEELCFGCVKNVTVPRPVIGNNGQIVDEDEIFSIKVKPGWTKGTRITFEGTKNESKGTHSCDVIFVITEKTHELYRREGDDLELVVRIPLLQALIGCDISVPLLGGDKMKMIFDGIIEPGYQKIIEGQGMPKSKIQGHRGHLKITFLVDFPSELTEEQKRDLAIILQDCC